MRLDESFSADKSLENLGEFGNIATVPSEGAQTDVVSKN